MRFPRWAPVVAIVALSLVGAIYVDSITEPRDHFVSAPFTIPILIAASRLSRRAVLFTSAVTLIAAIDVAHVDRAPFVPSIFNLGAIVIVAGLALIIDELRLTTERRAREAEAARSQIQAILESTTNTILYVDAATEQVRANREAEQLFGPSLVSGAGRFQFLGQVYYPDDRPVDPDAAPTTRALRGERVTQEELLVHHTQGQHIPVLVSAAPVRDHNGVVLGAVTTFQDITGLKELERLRQEWTSVIAHDLRQPVTIIFGYADLLARQLGTSPDETVARAIGHIRASAHQLRKMISDLLDVSRIEARRLTLSCETVDIVSLVRAVTERMAEITVGHPVRVSFQGEIPLVTVDPTRIEQVVGNLLSNAAKYGDPTGEILVDVERREQAVVISVTNRGPGIPPEELPRLFERFYRTKGARAGRTEGLGLGLYISKGLVEAHGGRMEVQSTPGQTTTFSFTVPIPPGPPTMAYHP